MTATTGIALAPENPVVAALEKLTEFVRISRKAQRLLSSGISPTEYLELLARHGFFDDGSHAVPFLLPNRHAVWWGALSIAAILRKTLPEPEQLALGACVDWVTDPTPAARQKAAAFGASAGTATPTGALATAITYAEISANDRSADDGVDPVLAARFIKVSVTDAYFRGGRKPEHLASVVLFGLDILQGKNLWDGA